MRALTRTGLFLLALTVAVNPMFGQTNNWKDNGANSYHNGKIGIHTTTPGAAIDLQPPNGGATGGVNFKLYEYTYFGTIWSSWATVLGMNVKADETANNRMQYALTHAEYGGVAIYMRPNLGLQFHTAPAPSTVGTTFNSPRMTIDMNGNVGIGTASGDTISYKLQVQGNAFVSGTLSGGNIQATYQDLAEWVPTTTEMAPGTVVILDPARDNHVLPSKSSYDTTVAGVVSAQPGITLGIAGDDKEKIATTGRVKVRVDATKGAIKVGDLLVTSDIPGMAMKSQPVSVGGVSIHRPGTIIGKALESLSEGQGEILVLLSMQ
ncbi:MAG TPA: hypothetical protein VEK11_22180 [Thermoanaerobaculia bacterium]|nr:hypothetical protein [Thermoanaerobaculia bacterium]